MGARPGGATAAGEVAAPGTRLPRPGLVTVLWRFCRKKPLGAAGGVVMLLMVLTAVFANYLATHDPIATDTPHTLPPPPPPPSPRMPPTPWPAPAPPTGSAVTTWGATSTAGSSTAPGSRSPSGSALPFLGRCLAGSSGSSPDIWAAGPTS